MNWILPTIFWTVLWYWGLPFVISMIYVLWLWLISRDVKYEGMIWWRKVFPAFRFRLISTKSWYARLWERWYGCALFCVIIHKDEFGPDDDRYVERTIVHEMRHVQQQWILGIFHWFLYALHSAYLAIFTKKHPYQDNFLERDARAAAALWVRKGRPTVFRFGSRR